MNPRIKELIKQCTSWSDGSTWTQREVFDKEKFAELIVREAIEQILNWRKEPFPFDEQTAVWILKEHFGVER